MRHLGWILLALILVPASALHAKETRRECSRNCRPGDQTCLDCCRSQDEALNGAKVRACKQACGPAKTKCDEQCASARKSCPSKVDECDRKKGQCLIRCTNALSTCNTRCDEQRDPIAGNCPGEVAPQKCPFKCQGWNEATHSCVGPPRNDC